MLFDGQEHESFEIGEEVWEECQSYCGDWVYQCHHYGRCRRPEEESDVEY